MSETEQDQRTERASPKRLQDARERGQVPRSRDLSGAAVFAAALAVLLAAGGSLASGAQRWLGQALQPDSPAQLDASQLPAFAGALALKGFMLVSPLLIATFVAALASPLLIGGWTFSSQALAPDFSRISPLKGLGRMFSSQALAEVGKAVLKAVLIFGIAGAMLWQHREAFIALGGSTVTGAFAAGLGLCLKLLAQLGFALLLIAGTDVAIQLWSYHRGLRMTREELREEFKQSEGRPEVKAKIRSMQQQLATRRMMEAVPKANVVVINPTHYAVALQYKEGMRAPKVVAKGADEVAARIREIAREHRVPLLSAPPLARALYRSCDIGTEIPSALYSAVAQVLTWVYQLKRNVSGPLPTPHIELPPGSDPEGKIQ